MTHHLPEARAFLSPHERSPITSANLLSVILDSACSNPSMEDPGWNVYRVETHCIGFEITARKHEDDWIVLSTFTYLC